MRWSHLFSSTIRNRGFLYYKNGHVEKVHKAGNTYTGTVTGSSSHIYQVTVTVKMMWSAPCPAPVPMPRAGSVVNTKRLFYT